MIIIFLLVSIFNEYMRHGSLVIASDPGGWAVKFSKWEWRRRKPPPVGTRPCSSPTSARPPMVIASWHKSGPRSRFGGGGGVSERGTWRRGRWGRCSQGGRGGRGSGMNRRSRGCDCRRWGKAAWTEVERRGVAWIWYICMGRISEGIGPRTHPHIGATFNK